MTASPSLNLKQWLAATTGLDPQLLERSTLDHWVSRRLGQLCLSDVREYLSLLREDADELERLVGEVSVPETWFFRYPESFRLLIEFANARRTLPKPEQTLRMLSIACATGEEPYSMAMAAVHAGWSYPRIVVDAIDRNRRSLETARLATYGPRSLRQAPPDWAKTWLQRSEENVRVDPHLMSTVNFIQADVLDTLLPDQNRPYDIIFCRNLLIYLNEDARKSLIAKIFSWLSPHGLLFVGHAENLDAFHSQFRRLTAPHAFALRRHHTDGPEPSTGSSSPPRRETATAARKWARTKTRRSIPGDTSAPPSDPAARRIGRPLEPEATLDGARVLADVGDLVLSLAAAKCVLARDGPNADILELLGNVHLALGNLEEAHDALTKALYFDPAREDVLLQLSMIHLQMNDGSLAERYRQRAARSHQTRQGGRPP